VKAFSDPDRVFHYCYLAENRSILTPVLRRLVFRPLALAMPRWVSPNLLSLTANGAVFVAFVALGIDRFWYGATPSMICFFAALCVLVYTTLDNTDGLLAARLGVSGPLGDFVDHWLDASSAFLLPVGLVFAAGGDSIRAAIAATLAAVVFWATNWERQRTGVLHLPRFGDVEANLALAAAFAITGFAGTGFWSALIYGVPLLDVVLFLSGIGALASSVRLLAADGLLALWQISGMVFVLAGVAATVKVTDPSGPKSFWIAIALGLAGAKHVGDLQRNFLIGTTYRPYDVSLLLCALGLALVSTLWSAEFAASIALTLFLLVVTAKLSYQFWHTTTFVCRSLSVPFFVTTPSPNQRCVLDREAPVAPYGAPTEQECSARRTYWRVTKDVSGVIPLVAWLVIGLQVAVGLETVLSSGASGGAPLAPIGLTALITLALFLIVDGLVSRRRPGLLNIANIVLSAGLVSLAAIRWSTGQSLDFFFVADNIRELFHVESLAMIVSSVGVFGWGVAINAIAGIVLVSMFVPLFRATGAKPNRMLPAAAGLFVAVVLLSPFYHNADATFLARSAIDYRLGVQSYGDLSVDREYPYLRAGVPSAPRGSRPCPHVFLVMLESFNAAFAEALSADGREYTPMFNRAIGSGIYVERFYGNSIQTAPGQQATLLSLIPSYRGKLFTTYPDISVQSVASILKGNGYKTYFFQGQPSIEFDNLDRFLPRIGFDGVYGMEGAFVQDEDPDNLWGWGLQDDRLYAKVFEFLDQRASEETKKGESAPLFTVIATASHHWPFNRLPSDRQFLFPNATDRREQFANSIHLADKYLGAFLGELQRRPQFRDSLVFILGDHSFPAGEHGNHFNERGFYEENFRTPLLILWPGRLPPARIAAPTFSQLDIAPTLLDLLKIADDHHFQGRSIFSRETGEVPIPLVQPYDGTYLGTIRYPFKYVKGLRVPGEYLFDLEKDPKELHNVVDQHRGTELYRTFQRDIEAIHLNQQLIERNRIWPPSVDTRSHPGG